MLKVGDQAPTFTLPLDNGEKFDLSQARGKHVVLYFYPKDNTPGCTLEAIDFTRLASKFEEANTWVIGISKDDMVSHQCFRKDHQLAVKLASDEKQEVANLYGVIGEKMSFGKKSVGLIRSTFWVDPQGVIRGIWSPVKVEGHAAAVLKAIQSA